MNDGTHGNEIDVDGPTSTIVTTTGAQVEDFLPHKTKGLCPVCRSVVKARLLEIDGKVVMEKSCPDHGPFETTVSSDAEHYLRAMEYERPGKEPLLRMGTTSRGCPEDCGLCPDHRQHSCVGVIEVTKRCDLGCAVCFADSHDATHIPLDSVKGMIDLLVKCEGEPEVLQISGGEPTTHPDILEILAYAGTQGVRYPMLNTNGLRLSDPEFARSVSETVASNGSPIGTPVIYLQFDGVTETPYEVLRGRSMLAQKLRVIENCRRFGMSVVLVPTLVRGVNDHEMGAIIEMALRDPVIKGVNFQPAVRIGRFSLGTGGDPPALTIPEVLDAIEEQTEGSVGSESFATVPCPHPACSVCSYVYHDEQATVGLLELVDTDRFMNYMADQAVPFGQVVGETLESASTAFSLPDLAGVDLPAMDCCPGGFKVPELARLIDHVTLVSVHAFMDPSNFDLDRAQKCCVTEVLPDGRMIPFCVYNNLYRGDGSQLGGPKVDD